MESGTPPKAPSPSHANDTEVSSQKDSGHGGGGKIAKAMPEGQTSGSEHVGEKIPADVDGGGYLKFSPQSDTIPEANKAPESGGRPPLAGGGVPIPSATFVQLEVLDALLAALKGASIIDEYRVLMGAVIEKIQSAES